MADLIQIRRDVYENWDRYNPVLAEGEIGIITHSGSVALNPQWCKVGDGTTSWQDLPVQAWAEPGLSGSVSETIQALSSSVETRILDVSSSVSTRIETISSSLDTRVTLMSSSLESLQDNIGHYTCNDQGIVVAKTVSATNYTRITGGAFKVKFNYKHTATSGTVTLKVGNAAAANLYYGGAPVTDNNTWEAGETVDVYFDGQNYMANNVSGGGTFATGQKVKNVSLGDVPGTSQTTLMSQKGATDLVSEYNVSTNNNNAEYTFAQAVALVPASLQKGGLTIKYIDSTTHEYDIKRLMSSTWNTTESNWQGIDDEPTAGSDNLVKSGGVAELIDTTHLANPTDKSLAKAEDVMQLKAKLKGVTASDVKITNINIWKPTESSYTGGYYRIENGVPTWVNNNAWLSTRIDVGGYKSVRFQGYEITTSTPVCYGLTDSNGNFLNGYYQAYSGGASQEQLKELSFDYIPDNAKYLVCLYKKGESGVLQPSNFYCYVREGNTVKEEIDRLSNSIYGKAKKYEEINLDEAEKLYGCYIGTDGGITASASQTSYCSYLPVRKGKYLVVAEPISDVLEYNTVVAGYKKKIPTIDTQIQGVTTGILRGYNATTGSDHIPAPIRMEVYVLEDSYFVFYNNPIGSTVSLYRIESVEENAQYDTYVEEDIYSHFCPTPARKNTNVQRIKVYLLEEGVNYKVIYRTFKNQSFNSILFKDASGVTIGTSNDANTNSDDNPVEHIMEDIIIPTGAVYIQLQYYVSTLNAAGTADIGMAALMKPLKDDGTMPQNELVYFVSKVKKEPFPNEPQSTIVQTDIWSAWGVKFPQGHNLKGKPTPLCAYFHGTGGYVTSEVLSYSYPYGTKMHNLLLDNGIAVFDINGKGISFQADGEYGVAKGTRQRHWGCPAAVATAKKAYQVLTERFNCRKGMVVGGCSMGGDIIESYINTYPNDAVACFACAPTNLGALVRTTSFKTNPNSETARAWDSENGDLTNLIGYSKLIYPSIIDENGYVKIWDNMKFTDMYPGINGDPGILDIPQNFVAPWPVETIIWHGTNDTNVNICQSKVWVDAARKAGCNMKLRICDGYEHPLLDFFYEIVDFVKSKLLI